MESSDALIREYGHKANGQYRGRCPACSELRSGKNKTDKCLSVKVQWPDLRWNCHHCGASGGANLRPTEPKVIPLRLPPKAKLKTEAQNYLSSRGLSEKTVTAAGVISAERYIRSAGSEVLCAGFPYIEPETDRTYAVKWRSLDQKGFSQDGAASTMWGIEKVKAGDPIIIFEGEIDALSGREAGLKNCVSVPNGAPIKVSENFSRETDVKFDYIWSAFEVLKASEKIIIGVDSDGPGQALGEELARRIGKAKCYSVTWPDGCKDANDTLLTLGRAAVANAIDSAEAWPIAGLYAAFHYGDQVRRLFHNGEIAGLSTGFPNLDGLWRVKTGMLHVVTGIPSMGKSEFLDQILFNLSVRYGWSHAICSFENPPATHISKLSEKIIGKPFRDEDGGEQMSEDELSRALDWVGDHFLFMEQSDGSAATIDDILERGSAAVARGGVRTLTIDPYNYLELNLGARSETNLISDMLSKVRNWAASHDCAVFFVAHPAKLYRSSDGSYPIPKGYDISSSASWFAKADLGITVHRNFTSERTEIHVWKARFKHLGKPGIAEFKYNIATGTYSEAEDAWPTDF